MDARPLAASVAAVRDHSHVQPGRPTAAFPAACAVLRGVGYLGRMASNDEIEAEARKRLERASEEMAELHEQAAAVHEERQAWAAEHDDPAGAEEAHEQAERERARADQARGGAPG